MTTVALVAPAGPVAPERLERALAVLDGWGVGVRNLVTPGARHAPYLADSDAVRAKLFTEAWLDPEVGIVLAARGGYGTQRMLDLLDWPALRGAGATVFAGSSDVTALHAAIHRHLGLPTLFSPMPAGDFWDDVGGEHLRRALFSPGPVTLPGTEALVAGTARGRLTGGNLSLLAAGVGTPEQGGARDRIVVLEDVTEPVYRLDRMLTQLLRSGWFDGVAGIVLGTWTGCGEATDVRALMLDRLGPLDVPILAGVPFGHVEGSLTVPLGVEAVLDTAALTVVTDAT
ncbi:S66 peptidase family protein [Amycolatopsis thermophila]|uniref:Muramoyltetrapeptide carboxypeptidase n=1 Tax=Amycolatopsis thermophila TaxID=206084 RepID=A0ABU0F267_9PSEU|nr:LD-carboxypeptidase [Amycolatopsis thermophila]MDQ0381676.1 muramoyltetrapeptide carboxypeptidase [Amycolatopsis thermophila]